MILAQWAKWRLQQLLSFAAIVQTQSQTIYKHTGLVVFQQSFIYQNRDGPWAWVADPYSNGPGVALDWAVGLEGMFKLRSG